MVVSAIAANSLNDFDSVPEFDDNDGDGAVDCCNLLVLRLRRIPDVAGWSESVNSKSLKNDWSLVAFA